MNNDKLAPVHPGEVLLEEFLKRFGLSQNRLSLEICVPPRRINEIVLGKRRITAETALRLGRYFGTTPQFWLGLQTGYDLDVAADLLGERLEREVRSKAPSGSVACLTATGESIVDMIGMRDGVDIEFEPVRLKSGE